MYHKIYRIKPSKEWIVTDENPLIRTVSTELDINNITKDDWNEISKMVSYIEASYEENIEELDIKPGIAITGVQIGYLKRVTYIHFEEGNTTHNFLMVNPIIKKTSSKKSFLLSGEGCLSVPLDHEGYIPRSESIIVQYYDPLKEEYRTISASGLLAICIQHEIDHMNGKLYYDYINKEDAFFVDKNWKKI